MLYKLLDKFLTDKKLILPAQFIINMALVYAGWRIFKYLGDNYDHFLWGGWDWFKDTMGTALTACAAGVLKVMGYQLVYYGRLIVVDGTPGMYIGDLCLGIAPLVIFTGFIATFGNNAKAKLWFIPLGLALILGVNVLRLVALVLVAVHQNTYFKLAHTYVYVILTYGLIFLLVMYWMNRLAFKKLL